jgi:hypothetical protein
VAALTWSGDDGFDETGTRAASIISGYEDLASGAVPGGHGPGFFAPRRFWEAFVARDGAFERVIVEGRPGRWNRRDEAKAAAESAYRARLAEVSSDPGRVAARHGAAVARRDAVDDDSRKVTGVLGHVRSLVRAWRSGRPSDQE